MSGSIFAFSLPSNIGVPYTLFGANLVNTPSYAPISPNLLMSAQLGFQEAVNASLGTVAAYDTAQIGTFQSLWAGPLSIESNISTLLGNAFASVSGKSATACSGFISCLFS